MRLKPRQLAMEYYFGDLQYWKIPQIAADALEEGYDGPALRMLAGITHPTAAGLEMTQIDVAFREMGVVDAPISKNNARLFLAAQVAEGVMHGRRNTFEAATYIRLHLCEINEPPAELRELWRLAEDAQHAPRRSWPRLEEQLRQAFSNLIESQNKH